MERVEQRRIAEALILGAAEPVSAGRLAEIVPGVRPADVPGLVGELNAEYAEQRRAFEVVESGGGFQLRTLGEFAPYLQQTLATRPLKLSPAALETLAVVAYRQPVTRAEIEHVRGVDVGAVLRSLLERRLVRIAGHREVAGRPLLYATTRRFLEVFGLARLEDLPTLRDLQEFAPAEDAAGTPGVGAFASGATGGDPLAAAEGDADDIDTEDADDADADDVDADVVGADEEDEGDALA
jgi:segregation and condensation protein B